MPARSDNAVVNITVIDVNDNTPKFSGKSYSEKLDELSTIVLTVTATDSDSGTNGMIDFSIGNFTFPDGLFRITSGGDLVVADILR